MISVRHGNLQLDHTKRLGSSLPLKRTVWYHSATGRTGSREGSELGTLRRGPRPAVVRVIISSVIVSKYMVVVKMRRTTIGLRYKHSLSDVSKVVGSRRHVICRQASMSTRAMSLMTRPLQCLGPRENDAGLPRVTRVTRKCKVFEKSISNTSFTTY